LQVQVQVQVLAQVLALALALALKSLPPTRQSCWCYKPRGGPAVRAPKGEEGA